MKSTWKGFGIFIEKSFQHSSNRRSENVLKDVGSGPVRYSGSGESNTKLKIVQR